MKDSEGQKHITSLLFKGIDADTDPELLMPDHGSVRHAAHMRRTINGTYKRTPGDVVHFDRTLDAFKTCVGLFNWSAEDYLVEFQYSSQTPYKTTIYIANYKVAEHEDIPGDRSAYVDAVIDNDDGIIYATDGGTPVAYDLMDMLDSIATDKYFADYDKDAHRLQLTTHVNQPVFVQLENVGAGQGVEPGSYSYSIRYADPAGNVTNWSPSTPLIPVHQYTQLTTPNDTKYGLFSSGSEPSITGTKYGIRIRFRVTNTAGFTSMHIKRVPNNTGLSPDFTSAPEYITLVADADGNLVDIANTTHDIIDFVDKKGLTWLTLDESSEFESAPIKYCNAVRLIEGRLVLGGVEYESRDLNLSDSAFLVDGETKRIQPINMDLGLAGFKDTWNQVYRKSHMRGERYGYAVQIVDDMGGLTFASGVPGNTNFKFFNRREVLTGISETLSNKYTDERPNYATVASHTADVNDRTFEAFSYKANTTMGSALLLDIPRILDEKTFYTNAVYSTMTPTGQNDKRDAGFMHSLPTDMIESSNYQFQQAYGNHIWSLGAAFTGMDVSLLPSWARGFKIVRTPAAGRVVCQGIGTFVFEERTASPWAVKKNWLKLMFYSPDIDPAIGVKGSLYDDILNNPEDYEIQLVSPLGYTTAMYSNHEDVSAAEDFSADLLSYANIYYENQIYSPWDDSAHIGRASGYVTFGRFRNYIGLPGYDSQGAAISNSTNQFIWGIKSTVIARNGGQFGNGNGRGNLLELEIDDTDTLYAFDDELTEEAGTFTNNRAFNEPWYIVNIIKDGASVLTNNTTNFEDTGVYQKLKALIGEGNATSTQVFQLVDERFEDYAAQEAGTVRAASHRYILVNDQKWMDVTHETAGNITTWDGTINTGGGLGTGSFTVYGGTFYGMYTVTGDRIAAPKVDCYINFDVDADIINYYPAAGWGIEVVYNADSPIIVFGGDVTVGETFCAIIDNEVNGNRLKSEIAAARSDEQFSLRGPVPAFTYTNGGAVAGSHVYDLPAIAVDPNSNNEYEYLGKRNTDSDYIRQWVVGFYCESRSNIALAYGDVFPQRNYVQRPCSYGSPLSNESTEDYFERIGLFGGYYNDYGDEHLKWNYGGFHLPQMCNFDYSKKSSSRSTSKPLVGYTERTKFDQRILYSLEKRPDVQNSPSLRTFLPFNYYDMKRPDLGEIKMLYDDISSRGRNLYAITESGMALLYTNKTMLRDVTSAPIGLLQIEGQFIHDELWISVGLGCPYRLSRSKSQGTIETVDGKFMQALAFVNRKGIMLFYNNQLINIISNWRDTLLPICKGLPQGISYRRTVTCFNERNNELWVDLGNGAGTYVFNFFQNNWTHRLEHEYERMIFMEKGSFGLYADWPYIFGSVQDRIYSVEEGTFTLASNGANNMTPYIELIINPSLHESWEFIDMLIHANAIPSQITYDTTPTNVSPNIDTSPAMRNFNPGYYSKIGLRNSGAKSGKALQGPYLRVKIEFDVSQSTEYEIKALRTGIKNMIG